MGSNTDPNENHNCGMCNRSDSANNMVGCDLCGMWAHFDCAGVTDSIGDPDRSWKCDNCKEMEAAEVSSRKSHSSHHSKTSQRSKQEIRLSLQLLEEDQRLRLKHLEEEEAARKKAYEEEERARQRRMEEERRYLKERFDLLRARIDSVNDGASRRSNLSSRKSREKVEEWLSRDQGRNNNKSVGVPPLPGQTDVQHSANPMSISQIDASANATIVDPPPGMILPGFAAQQNGAQGNGQVPPNSTSTPQSSHNPPGVMRPLQQTTISDIPSSIPVNYPVTSAIPQIIPASLNALHGNPLMNGYGMNGFVPTGVLPSSSGFPPPPASTAAVPPLAFPPPSTTTTAVPPPVFSMPSSTAAVPPLVYPPLPITTTALLPPPFSMAPATTAAVPPPVVSLPPIPSMSGPWLPSSFALPGTFPGGIDTSAGTGVQPIPSYWPNQNLPVLPCDPQPPLVPQVLPIVPNPQRVNIGPSAVQLAARQVMSRDLPKFTGDPEDWPMFHSAFYNTTQACGYSDAENLARLQRCLDGPALQSVKSRLLLPESVPYVIETLQKLYGRPEVLIHSLLNKLRDVSAPKVENLRSVIEFGLAVQNLVDHMKLAQLHEHLCNPMLLHELVEKLPAIWKMQWSTYKRACSNVNLATFGGFMSDLVNTASDVTLPDLAASSSKATKQNRNKSKLYVHSQSSQDGEEAPKPKPVEETTKKTCAYCSNADHEVISCGQFKALDVDARWKAMRQKGLCRVCLVPHRKWPCRSGKECGVDGCRLRHHALLHSRNVAVVGNQAGTSSSSGGSGAVVHQNYHQVLPCTLFRYLPVTIEAGEKQVHTFAFLDDGSSSTLMEARIATELGLEGSTDSLWLNWTGNVSREEKGSMRVSIVISGRDMKNRYKLSNVRTVQKLNLPVQTLQYNLLKETYPHLKGLPVHSYSEAVPGIIIGLEHARLLSTLKIREGRSDDPVAAKTRLGWCIFGRHSGEGNSLEHLHHHSEAEMGNRELHEQMKNFFGIEESTITIKPEAEVDKRAKEIMENTTRRVGSAFETGLLWKHDEVCFPDSFKMAEKRLIALEKRLDRDPTLKQKVHEQIAAYEEKGYAHRITEEELHTNKKAMISSDPSRVWYLPLGVVQNPNKPGKVRLIWDAAARSGGVCFNDMLLKGPDLLTSLVAILLRFRQRNIAMCGDIREMFHQILIRDLDKQAQRFLWRLFPDLLPQIFVMDVATFGATCSPSSAQFVKNRNAAEYASQYPRAAHAIINSHYVDDYLDSVDTIDEAVQLWNEVKFVHSQGGFEIRNFICNSAEVIRRVGEKDSPVSKSMNLDQTEDKERVLGMVWKPSVDIFTFDANLKPDVSKLILEQVTPTKRQVLRTVMSLFDPLGLIAHFVVQGKVLMQDIWRSGTDWDEPIAEHLWEKWSMWSQLLLKLGAVQIPRCFFSGANGEALNSVQLHVFVDASQEAYACVAYLRIVDTGVPRCALVAAKSKVAPLKPLSIPRLELQAAMIGSRLADSICKYLSLPISQRFLWLDSSTVLAWLRSDSRRYHPFVAFRVGEILSLTTVDEWHHLKSKHNVADEATKWGSGPNLYPEGRWFQGPPFLNETVESWPMSKEDISPVTEELRAVNIHHHATFQPLIEVTRFSKWHRLLRSAAYVLRAVKKFKGQQLLHWISNDEYREAENLLWRQVQIECYPDEYSTLHHNKQNPEVDPIALCKSSQLYQQTPYLDDAGVIRMNSRIGAAPNAPFQAKYPIILPKNHHVTSLLVDSYHRRFLHANNETVLNEIQQRFRIPTLRNQIKRVCRECQLCRVKKATPRPPVMAPLPTVRLMSFVRPFTHTGVDYFGPILVKQGRSLVKRWVALFTCLSVRAVHLEIVHSLTTQSCVMAIRRFVARRGAPESFYSDNGTNFVGASNLLTDQLRKVNEHCAVTFTSARTNWQFNPPAAPHMGGAWERLVRSVKTAMSAISDHPHHPSDEVLETVVLEAEAVVNSRPLTYVPLESSDEEAITPNHFLLYGTRGINQPPTPLIEGVATLRDSWKLAQCLVDHFWRRWIREYLPDLARRTKWYQPVKPLQVGDLVIVIDENRRNGWTRGRIIEVMEGKDGQVRRAAVRTSNGVVIRPAVKLALLDVGKGALEKGSGSSRNYTGGGMLSNPPCNEQH